MSLLTRQEVADKLGVSVDKVSTEVKNGNLKAIKMGKTYRFNKDDIDAFISSNETKSSEHICFCPWCGHELRGL